MGETQITASRANSCHGHGHGHGMGGGGGWGFNVNRNWPLNDYR